MLARGRIRPGMSRARKDAAARRYCRLAHVYVNRTYYSLPSRYSPHYSSPTCSPDRLRRSARSLGALPNPFLRLSRHPAAEAPRPSRRLTIDGYYRPRYCSRRQRPKTLGRRIYTCCTSLNHLSGSSDSRWRYRQQNIVRYRIIVNLCFRHSVGLRPSTPRPPKPGIALGDQAGALVGVDEQLRAQVIGASSRVSPRGARPPRTVSSLASRRGPR